MIKDVNRRPVCDLPLRGNRTGGAATVPPASPGQVVFDDCGFDRIPVFVGIHSEQNKGPASHFFHERPLMRVKPPAGTSPVPPEVEHYDFATVVRKPEGFSIDILPCDLWCFTPA